MIRLRSSACAEAPAARRVFLQFERAKANGTVVPVRRLLPKFLLSCDRVHWAVSVQIGLATIANGV
jgi:hypothetical protein